MTSRRPTGTPLLQLLSHVSLFSVIFVVANVFESSEQTKLDQQQILKLIEELDAPNTENRDAAAKILSKHAIVAWPQLMAAREKASDEIRFRADQILRQLKRRSLSEAFQEYAKQPDEALNIEEGMWLISRILNADADCIAISQRLDSLAEKVRHKLGKNELPLTVAPEKIVGAFREVLFVDEGFTGNESDYSNPENSSLELVLDSRKGLPIVLSHLTICVAKRLELPFVGIPTPGRFIVKYDGKRAPKGFSTNDIYLDPFDHGKILSRDDRAKLFPSIDPDEMVPEDTNRDVLTRMLYNIETHLFERISSSRANLAVEFRTALQSKSK